MSAIIKLAAPTTAPVTPSTAGSFLRVDDDTAEAGDILDLINVGWQLVEEYTGRALAATTFRWLSSGWPRGRAIPLRRSPLVSVQSVKYYDEDGVQQTVDPSSYSVNTTRLPGEIVFDPEFEFPGLDPNTARPDMVSIDFTAGAGNDVLNLAVKMFVAQFYTHRVPVITGTISAELPISLKLLLRSQKVSSNLEP